MSQKESFITQYTGNTEKVSRPPINKQGSGKQTGSQGSSSSSKAGASNGNQGLLSSFLCCVRPYKDVCDVRTAGNVATAVSHRSTPRAAPRTPVRKPLPHAPLMAPMLPEDRGKKSLVLDLDETLVHSSFKPVPNPDFIIPVEIDNRITDVYVLKRPWVDDFIKAVGDRFEIVIYTASLSKYANPLLDLLDPDRVFRYRLFREDCTPYEGNYVKDLANMGRPLKDVIIIDNSPHSYAFQPENAIPISSFIDDPEDQELLDLIPYLIAMQDVEDVRTVLGGQH
eukprot:jgi/Mesvir1/1886/Mv22916-RA.1